MSKTNFISSLVNLSSARLTILKSVDRIEFKMTYKSKWSWIIFLISASIVVALITSRLIFGKPQIMFLIAGGMFCISLATYLFGSKTIYVNKKNIGQTGQKFGIPLMRKKRLLTDFNAAQKGTVKSSNDTDFYGVIISFNNKRRLKSMPLTENDIALIIKEINQFIEKVNNNTASHYIESI